MVKTVLLYIRLHVSCCYSDVHSDPFAALTKLIKADKYRSVKQKTRYRPIQDIYFEAFHNKSKLHWRIIKAYFVQIRDFEDGKQVPPIGAKLAFHCMLSHLQRSKTWFWHHSAQRRQLKLMPPQKIPSIGAYCVPFNCSPICSISRLRRSETLFLKRTILAQAAKICRPQTCRL